MVVEAPAAAKPKVKPTEYRSGLKSIWCPGCGDYGVLNSVYQALAALEIPSHKAAVISGIGCSSRIPGYCSTYGFNAVHGRALPIATGVKVVSPETTVIAAGGDGDGLSIGGGHFPHAGRRNVDITYIMMDNNIYGLTKGQVSPTTPIGDTTKSTPYGSGDEPLDAVALALAYNVSFVARGFSGDVRHLAKLIVKGIQHRGFAFIHVFTACPTFRGIEEFKAYKERVIYLDETHDAKDRSSAYAAAVRSDAKVPLGIFFRRERDTLEDIEQKTIDLAHTKPIPPVEDVMKQFLP